MNNISSHFEPDSSEKSRAKKYFIFIFFPVLTFFLGIFFGVEYLYATTDVSPQERTAFLDILPTFPSSEFKLFDKIYKNIHAEYLHQDDIKKDILEYGAIGGMVDALGDDYSYFLTPKQYEMFRDDLGGKLIGIGAELGVESKKIFVVTPLKGSPAEKAGLKAQDILLAVDGENILDMSLFEVVMKIRGEQGTEVTLDVLRPEKNISDDSELEYNKVVIIIIRDEISLPSVTLSWDFFDTDQVAHLAINRFSDTTMEEFVNHINALLLKKPKGLILDLRDNGGGYLDAAVEISSDFIPTGTIVAAQGEGRSNNFTHMSYGYGRLASIPLVVLINEQSASASEIVAGAIRDHNAGILVGEKSFGKGTMQNLVEFADGSALRMTVAHWLTPNNTLIDKHGIIPDHVVSITKEDIQNQRDPQIQKALELLR
jgi:carboxyl-terminal processing protease